MMMMMMTRHLRIQKLRARPRSARNRTRRKSRPGHHLRGHILEGAAAGDAEEDHKRSSTPDAPALLLGP